jgi:ribosome-binding protein aMBF1 (putative translation factor)
MAGTSPREALATTLTNAAESRGISTSELSRETHIPRETLRRKLAGASEFDMGELSTLAAVLDLDLATLATEYTAAKAAA